MPAAKKFALHIIAILVFSVVVLLSKRIVDIPSVVLFLLGGVIGTMLPELDHLLYIFVSNPHELTSARTFALVKAGQIKRAVELIIATKDERPQRMFHTLWFQLCFFLLTVLLITSSAHIMGHGVVIGFSLHLLVSQVYDLFVKGNINQWFDSMPILIEGKNNQVFFWVIALLVTTLLAIFF